MALPDDDDGFSSRFDPNEDLLHVVVPDDLRELAAEVTAYRRELEIARRQQRRQQLRYRFTPGWARGGLPSPVFTAILLVIATTGLLLSVFAPVTQQSARQLPISSLAHTNKPDGTKGGLLPDVQLVDGSDQIRTRAVRPAVFVLVPTGCQCASLIYQIVGQVNEVSPSPYTVLVSQDDSAAALADDKNAGHSLPLGVRDVDGALAQKVHASTIAPTLLLVRRDGVLVSDPRVFHDGVRLETLLEQLRS